MAINNNVRAQFIDIAGGFLLWSAGTAGVRPFHANNIRKFDNNLKISFKVMGSHLYGWYRSSCRAEILCCLWPVETFDQMVHVKPYGPYGPCKKKKAPYEHTLNVLSALFQICLVYHVFCIHGLCSWFKAAHTQCNSSATIGSNVRLGIGRHYP